MLLTENVNVSQRGEDLIKINLKNKQKMVRFKKPTIFLLRTFEKEKKFLAFSSPLTIPPNSPQLKIPRVMK